MITPNDSKAIVPSLDKAKQAGMLVIALDTPDRPAGRRRRHVRDRQLPGRHADRRSGPRRSSTPAGKQAKIAMLDLSPNGVSVDVQRDQGFLPGLRHRRRRQGRRSATSPTRGSSATTSPTATRRAAARRWRTCCRRTRRSTSSTRSTSPPRRAPTQALKAAGKQNDVTIVSVDGGCPGVAAVKAGQHRRHLAAVPAEDGAGGRRARSPRSPRTAPSRRTTAGKDLHRHRRHADHRPAAGRGRRPRTPPSASQNCWG